MLDAPGTGKVLRPQSFCFRLFHNKGFSYKDLYAVNGANADKWELGLDSLCCNDADKANITNVFTSIFIDAAKALSYSWALRLKSLSAWAR